MGAQKPLKRESRGIAAGRLLAIGMMLLAMAGCARPPMDIQKTALTEIHGRLLVIEPARRWQAMLDWHAPSPSHGWLRISHAASGRVIELRWEKTRLWLRDNQAIATNWRSINADELAGHGITLLPNEMAAFFAGQPPADFSHVKPGQWLAVRGKSHIRVQWNGKRMTITDIRHGRQAIVITQ